MQTRDGYLWFGTESGLVRFDGVKFATFNVKNTPAINSDNVEALLETSDGNLWIGTAQASHAIKMGCLLRNVS